MANTKATPARGDPQLKGPAKAFASYAASERDRRRNEQDDAQFDAAVFDDAVALVVRRLRAQERGHEV